jgi:hypothetical protein
MADDAAALDAGERLAEAKRSFTELLEGQVRAALLSPPPPPSAPPPTPPATWQVYQEKLRRLVEQHRQRLLVSLDDLRTARPALAAGCGLAWGPWQGGGPGH